MLHSFTSHSFTLELQNNGSAIYNNQRFIGRDGTWKMVNGFIHTKFNEKHVFTENYIIGAFINEYANDLDFHILAIYNNSSNCWIEIPFDIDEFLELIEDI